jgi:hypothetical protein
MVPYLLVVTSALSLLLSTAVASLWVRSYGIRDSYDFDRSGERWEVASDSGRLWLGNWPQQERNRAYARKIYKKLIDDNREINTEYAFILQNGPSAGRDALRHRELARLRQLFEGKLAVNEDELRRANANARAGCKISSIPYAFPLAITAVVPATWFVLVVTLAKKRLRRQANGCCTVCGYDLDLVQCGVPNAVRHP